MVNTTIGVRPSTGDRFRKGWFAMIGKLGRKISQSEVLDNLMDTAGWPKGKE